MPVTCGVFVSRRWLDGLAIIHVHPDIGRIVRHDFFSPVYTGVEIGMLCPPLSMMLISYNNDNNQSCGGDKSTVCGKPDGSISIESCVQKEPTDG